VYDMRANMPQFGKRTPFTRDYFRTPPEAPASQPRDKFEDVFGSDPFGGSAASAARQDTGATGRWRRFTREQIAQRGDNLDISWLKDDTAQTADAQRSGHGGPPAAARAGRCHGRVAGLAGGAGRRPDAALDDLPLDEPQADASNCRESLAGASNRATCAAWRSTRKPSPTRR
jgi:type I restriction enzyme M protein